MANTPEDTKKAVETVVAKYIEHKRNGRDHGSAFQAVRVSHNDTLTEPAWETVEDYLRKTAVPDVEKVSKLVLKELFNLDPDPK